MILAAHHDLQPGVQDRFRKIELFRALRSDGNFRNAEICLPGPHLLQKRAYVGDDMVFCPDLHSLC